MIEKPEPNEELRYDRLFIIGIDADGQPRGARFAEGNDFVAGAALDMGLTCNIPASERTAELGKELPEVSSTKPERFSFHTFQGPSTTPSQMFWLDQIKGLVSSRPWPLDQQRLKGPSIRACTSSSVLVQTVMRSMTAMVPVHQGETRTLVDAWRWQRIAAPTGRADTYAAAEFQVFVLYMLDGSRATHSRFFRSSPRGQPHKLN